MGKLNNGYQGSLTAEEDPIGLLKEMFSTGPSIPAYVNSGNLLRFCPRRLVDSSRVFVWR